LRLTLVARDALSATTATDARRSPAHPLASSPRRRLLQTGAITNANIKAAAAEWVASPTSAAAKYGPIAAWNTAGVTSMLQLFANATTFNEDLSQWNVACVTSMREMFLGAAAFDGKVRAAEISPVVAVVGGLVGEAGAAPKSDISVGAAVDPGAATFGATTFPSHSFILIF
jgi:hypothetical protein